MNYDSIHPILRAVLGAHEGFRKVGFPADDIYVELGANPEVRDDELMVFVTLKSAGKEFRVQVGPWPRDNVDALHTQWTALCAALHDIPQADADRIWHESLPFRNAVGFTLAIMNKGIPIPGPSVEEPVDTRPLVGPCTFCSGTVTLDAVEAIAVHTKPTCKKFRKLDPLAFVQAMNAHVAKTRRKETS